MLSEHLSRRLETGRLRDAALANFRRGHAFLPRELFQSPVRRATVIPFWKPSGSRDGCPVLRWASQRLRDDPQVVLEAIGKRCNVGSALYFASAFYGSRPSGWLRTPVGLQIFLLASSNRPWKKRSFSGSYTNFSPVILSRL